MKALWSPEEAARAIFSGLITERMARPALGPTPETAVKHLEAIPLFLGGKTVKGNIVFADVHHGVDRALLPGCGQRFAGGGGNLDGIAHPAAADHGESSVFFRILPVRQ